MDQPNDEPLLRLAAKYIWWKTPDEAIRHPRRVIQICITLFLLKIECVFWAV